MESKACPRCILPVLGGVLLELLGSMVTRGTLQNDTTNTVHVIVLIMIILAEILLNQNIPK
jgi:hypothetical protein